MAEQDKPLPKDNWNKNHTLRLIELFKNSPCLYNPLDVHFTNKSKRNEKWNEILTELQKSKESLTMNCLRTKIRTLQSQLSREKSKVANSKKSGVGTDDVYSPKLWCYNQLQFLLHCNDTEESSSNINPDHIGLDNSGFSKELGNKIPNKKKKMTELQSEAVETLVVVRKLLEQDPQRDKPRSMSKEEVFCNYLCEELKTIKLDETFHELKLKILMLVSATITEEKQLLKDKLIMDAPISRTETFDERLKFKNCQFSSNASSNSLLLSSSEEPGIEFGINKGEVILKTSTPNKKLNQHPQETTSYTSFNTNELYEQKNYCQPTTSRFQQPGLFTFKSFGSNLVNEKKIKILENK